MEQAGKNTILLVRGTAAEPVGLSAFAAAQPDVQLQTVSGLDEARAALARSRPTLIIMQSDAPGAQELRRCAFHPVQKRAMLHNEDIDYCADLSAMISYYDLRDGWEDERRVDRLAESALLRKAAQRAGEAPPAPWCRERSRGFPPLAPTAWDCAPSQPAEPAPANRSQQQPV